MRIAAECLPCIIEDIVDALELLEASRTDIDAVMAEMLRYLADHYHENEPASYYITEMHRIVKRTLHLDMPFARLREICLSSCTDISKSIERESVGFTGVEKLRFLIRWTIAANTLDFRTAGAGYDFASNRIEATLRRRFDEGLYVDNIDKIHDRLKRARHVVYVPDNVGELPFDKLLIAEINTYGSKCTMPFRGGPITSDVVMADATSANMKEVVDRIILSGPDTLGVSFREMTEECMLALLSADVIIGKGQANFYVLSEFGNQFPNASIVSLFSTKCNYVSRQFGREGKINVALLLKDAGGEITRGKNNP